MNRTCFLPVLVSGMALLLFPARATQSAPEKDRVRSSQQQESSAIQVDIDRDEPDMDMDIDVDIDVPDVDVEIDEPQVDVDVDREEVDHEDASFTEHEQEKIQKSFAMPAGAGRRTLEIDNVWGSIEVVG